MICLLMSSSARSVTVRFSRAARGLAMESMAHFVSINRFRRDDWTLLADRHLPAHRLAAEERRRRDVPDHHQHDADQDRPDTEDEDAADTERRRLAEVLGVRVDRRLDERDDARDQAERADLQSLLDRGPPRSGGAEVAVRAVPRVGET